MSNLDIDVLLCSRLIGLRRPPAATKLSRGEKIPRRGALTVLRHEGQNFFDRGGQWKIFDFPSLARPARAHVRG